MEAKLHDSLSRSLKGEKVCKLNHRQMLRRVKQALRAPKGRSRFWWWRRRRRRPFLRLRCRGKFIDCVLRFYRNFQNSPAAAAFRGGADRGSHVRAPIPLVSGCAPPITRRAVRSVFSSVVTASRRSYERGALS